MAHFSSAVDKSPTNSGCFNRKAIDSFGSSVSFVRGGTSSLAYWADRTTFLSISVVKSFGGMAVIEGNLSTRF